MKYKGIISIVFTFFTAHLAAQDLHFSQFYQSPLTTNPANTGFIPDADYRIGGNYRNQYSSIMQQPYKTMSLFADAQVFRDRFENGWLGLGAVVLSDVAGSGSLRSTKVYGSLAYHQMLGNSSLLSAGFNLGWANKRIDLTSLKFPDQFDGRFFDNTLPTAVMFNNTSVSYFDMQAGMNYAYFPTEDIYINAGYSVHHVNKPRETFFSDETNDGTIPMRHIGFLNALLKVAPNLIINPNLYYTNHANASEFVMGLNGSYNLSGAGEMQFIGGVYYRYKDAFIPTAGFEISNLRFIFSYDATTSSLKNFNQQRGALEISILKKGFYSQGAVRQTMCPSF
ncbi:MAG: type IX secretion system membrane protein PorP/SprF [Chitinophagaceae bacterium]|nr:MAG: type IX secretion system membrane protein PorP/SprF [Chitinophagaceae bacterium]